MQRKWLHTAFSVEDKHYVVGIVTSSYNSDITYPIREAAIETLITGWIERDNIVLSEAPGAFEIPYLCQQLAKKGTYDGIIAIGCIIRGDTDHYVYVAWESTRWIMDTMLRYDIPIANAILTVNTLEQAQIRSQWDRNKGVEAASALLALIIQQVQ